MFNINIKVINILVPVIFFYLIDLVVIHENKGLLQINIPILHTILNEIYNFVSYIIYEKFHSKTIAHTLIFAVAITLTHSLIEKYNFFNLKNKKIKL